jgi:MFS family permease
LLGDLAPVHGRRVAEPSFAVPASFRPTFTAGGTLSRGITALLQRPLTYLGFTLAQAIPVVLALGLLFVVIGPEDWARVSKTGSYPGWFWPIYIAACFAGLIPFGASLHAANEQLADRRVSFGASLVVGARRFLPLLAVYFLFGLAVLAGTLALLVPGIVLCSVYIVSLPIAVQEQRGILGALGRAARLSKGYRTTLFVIGLGYVGVMIAVYAGSLVMIFLLVLATQLTGIGSETLAIVVTAVVMAVLYTGLMALFPVLLGATYAGLREEKEGGTPEQVAGVFT